MVISSEVLMHVLPSEIEKVMIKIVDISNEHIINIDWYEKRTPWNAAPHNFIHQYEKIYRNLPTIVHFEIPTDDSERAKKFYTDLFGWKIEKWPGTDDSQLTSAAGQPMEYWI
ncbi:MAG: VOC family protein, partial [Candidatus Nitrosopolaris sp.]